MRLLVTDECLPVNSSYIKEYNFKSLKAVLGFIHLNLHTNRIKIEYIRKHSVNSIISYECKNAC